MSELPNPAGDPVPAESLAETIAEAKGEIERVEVAIRRPTLWRHADYMKVWTAAAISLMGSAVSQLGIPIIAAVVLNATPFEVALIGTVEMAPFLLFTLPAGAWLDRVRRRPVLILGDFGRGLALLTIPLAYALGGLTIWQLYAVGFVTGTLTVLFDVADMSYLPVLVDREDLVEANAKLQLPASTAQVIGPAFAGQLIGWVGAPFAVIVDAASFLASGGLISLIRKPEPKPQRQIGTSGAPSSARADIMAGLRWVLGNRYLRMIAACTGTSNLGTSISFSIFAIFAYRELGLSFELVGTAFGLGGLGILVGALISGPVSRRLGVGRTIVLFAFMTGPAMLLYASMPADATTAFLLLFGSSFISGVANVVYNVAQVSFRQAITPLDMQGRMNATMRFIVWGTIPLGSLIGGLLASFLPIRLTILIGSVVSGLAFLFVLLSPVRSLEEIPTADPNVAPSE